MHRFAGFVPTPSSPTKEPMEPTQPTPSGAQLQEDVEMSSGSSATETNENCSTGRGSQSSDCDDSGKELGLEPPDARQSPDAFSLIMAKADHNPSTSGCR